jgi:UDP-N-acetylmuramate dehydrogenase
VKQTAQIRHQVPLAPYTTLRAGGPAEMFAATRSVDELGEWVIEAQREGTPVMMLGWGSNLLPSDYGIPGLVLRNLTREIVINPETGEVVVDCGLSYQNLFLKTIQAGLRGLEYAVGIPGTVGGALVSNAGAYRSSINEYVKELEVVTGGERFWVDPSWMNFKYRDSRLREHGQTSDVVLRARFVLPKGSRYEAYNEARDFQRQRIAKQPPSPSAGSFFKNVISADLAASLPTLPAVLKAKGIVPAGYLIEHAGLKGFRYEGAMLGRKHANFMLNIGNAKATDIRHVAEHAKRVVHEQFQVTLEEEVLYAGDWSRYEIKRLG